MPFSRSLSVITFTALVGACSARPLPLPGGKDTPPRDGSIAIEMDAGIVPVPLAPVLSIIDDEEVLQFGKSVEIAVIPTDMSPEKAPFEKAAALSLAGQSGLLRVLAREEESNQTSALFDAVYDVRSTYPPRPSAPGTTAISHDDPRFVGWATGVEHYRPGPGVVGAIWMMPSQALGPAGTDSTEVVVLGEAGTITLTFNPPITNEKGFDFVVFENSFTDDSFLELAFVEVSSDGNQFVRFDSAFRDPITPCGNCSGTADQIGGLAGTYRLGFGTPFDLDALKNSPLVRSGAIDLNAISHVRIVDIVGDGKTLDSFGREIIDPLVGSPTAGFDLDAIGVLHQKK
jgi:hypothetical protein